MNIKKHKFLFYVIELQLISLINVDFTIYKKNFDKTYSIFVKYTTSNRFAMNLVCLGTNFSYIS